MLGVVNDPNEQSFFSLTNEHEGPAKGNADGSCQPYTTVPESNNLHAALYEGKKLLD